MLARAAHVDRVRELLADLLRDPPSARSAAASGVIPKLVQDLRRVPRETTCHADDITTVATLGLILVEAPSASTQCTGVIHSLFVLLDEDKGTARRVALATLLVLFRSDASTRVTAVHAGILERLRLLVSSAVKSVSRLAMVTLRTLMRDATVGISDTECARAVSELTRLADEFDGPDKAYAMLTLASLAGENADAEDDAFGELFPSRNAQQHGSSIESFLRFVLIHHATLHGSNDNAADITQSLVRSHTDTAWNELLVLEDLWLLLSVGDQLVNNTAVEAGVISLCIHHLNSVVPSTQQMAASILHNLVVYDETLCGAVLDGISVDTLVQMLDDDKRAAVLVLHRLLLDCTYARDSARGGGAIPVFVDIIQRGHASQRLAAAQILAVLLDTSTDTQVEALDAGAMEVLLQALPTCDAFAASNVLEVVLLLLKSNQRGKDEFLNAGGANLLHDILAGYNSDHSSLAVEILVHLVYNDSLAQSLLIEAGALGRLVQLLQHENASLGLNTLWALSSIVEYHPFTRSHLIHPPVLGRLVNLLLVGSLDSRVFAIRTLGFIASGDAGAQDAIASAGGIDALVQMLQSTEPEIAATTASTLSKLVRHHSANQLAVVRAGALAPLLAMLRDSQVEMKQTAATMLVNLVDSSASVKSTAVAAGIVPALVDVLEGFAVDDTGAVLDKSDAAQAVYWIVTGCAEHQEIAVDAGAVQALIVLIRDGTPSEKLRAANALAHLTKDCPAAKTRALDNGAITVLLKTVSSSAETSVSSAALFALGCILNDHPAAKQALWSESHAIGLLKSLLRDTTLSLETVTVLLSLVQDHVEAVWAAGVAELLVEMLQKSEDINVIMVGLSAISGLAAVSSRRRQLAELLPLGDLLGFVRAGSTELTAPALFIICLLIQHNDVTRAHAIDGGVVEASVDLLRNSGVFGVVPSLACLGALVGDCERAQAAAVQAGAVPLLCELMQTLGADEIPHAATALASIQAAQDDARASGVLQPLLQLVKSKDIEERAAGALALATFVENHPVNTAATIDAGAMPLLASALHSALASADTTETNEDEDTTQTCRDALRNVARAIATLAQHDEPAQDMAVTIGVIPVLEAARQRLSTVGRGDHDARVIAFVTTALETLTQYQQKQTRLAGVGTHGGHRDPPQHRVGVVEGVLAGPRDA